VVKLGYSLEKAKNEAVEILSELIKINTTNPPGNELPAAKYIAEKLEEANLETEIIKSEENRGNVICRIKGEKKEPSILLLSHLDVVPANASEWSIDPFSGIIKDGFIWGRGAIDCKSLTAIECVIMKLIALNNKKPKGDIIFAATADEEKGGGAGVEYIIKNYPEKIKTTYVINEGGGFSIPIGNKHIFLIQTAEKGIVWIKIKAGGVPAHGSMPGIGDNAILRMMNTINRIMSRKPPIMIIPVVKKFIKKISSEKGSEYKILSNLLLNKYLAHKILDKLAKKNKGEAEMIRSMISATITPTMINGGIKENIVPSLCETIFDCRILPGQTKEDLINNIKNIVKDIDKLEFEYLKYDEPTESPYETDFFKIIEDTLKEYDKNFEAVPYMVPGGTDSRFLRRIGSICYGFHPVKTDMPYDQLMRLPHGIDERISIKNIHFGIEILYKIIEKMMF
jgi:acetylornithine deacetylase/succinyl-diaminopimelate desuccinylase-like protein